MHTIAELSSFTISAKSAGMTDTERELVISTIAKNPETGEIIVGSGGCRKVRIAGKGKGKSGGYRVITYFYNENNPVYLLLAFAKNQSENISKAQIIELAQIVKVLKK